MLEQNPLPHPAPPRLVLLDDPALRAEGLSPHRLERKTAGLLAYLALEGATPRSRLAGLLWPEVDEERARSNLRQCLFRLRKAAGCEVVLPEEPLRLSPEVEADAARLEVLLFERQYEGAARLGGELLGGLDYDDCPEFADWLLAEQERLEGLRREAMRLESERLEGEGDLRGALGYAERWLEAEPVSELAHRRVMRLHYLLGDRSAAVAAFERCEAVLQKELGIKPFAETLELLRLIERGREVAAPANTPTAIPLTVLRPPVLVGREREWAEMEAAWARGQMVVLEGPPGVGKTRLLTDFVQAHGPFVLHQGRPGDAQVPYSFFSRRLREDLSRFPGLELPQWVRQELSRVLPELGGPPPSPIASEEQKLRFFEALAAAQQAVIDQGVRVVAVDDLQFFDPATLEANQYLFGRLMAGGKVRTLSAYRQGELDTAHQARLEHAVEAGWAVRIQLQALEAGGLHQLLQSLELPHLDGLVASLGRYTGGNPFFVLETLKSLWESGDLQHGRPERLPVAGKVKAVIGRRLERLSAFALNLARVAAVAASDFGPELAALVMDTSPLTLTEPWAELEAAQILQGNRFVHDLLFETVRDTLPAPIKTYLHRRVAEFLASKNSDPARVAGHWLEADNLSRAVPFLLEAAQVARHTYNLEETLRLYGSAADALETLGEQPRAFELVWETAQLLDNVAPSAHHQAVSARIRRMAQTPQQQATAGIVEGRWLTMMGQVAAGEKATRRGYQAALESGDARLEVELQNLLAINLWYQDRYPESIPLLQRSVHLSHNLGSPELIAPSTAYLGAAQVFLDRHLEARANLGQALHLLELGGEKLGAAQTLTTIAESLILSGQPRQALEAALKAGQLLEGVSGASERAFTVAYALSDCHYQLAQYGHSLEAAQGGLIALGKGDHRLLGGMHYLLARTLAVLGADGAALAHLEQALAHPANLLRRSIAIQMLQTTLKARAGQDVAGMLEQIKATIRPHWPASTRINLALQLAPLSPPDKAIPLAEEALELARSIGLKGFEVFALTRLAQGRLEAGQLEEARACIEEAALKSREVHPPFLYGLELPFTRYRVALALGSSAAQEHLEAALGWLEGTLETRVPPEYKEGFLGRNPINQAVLEAASAAKLALKIKAPKR
ncbi:MAG: AAA family ATPase [Meiothermus sp.]|nr:AAA family ATPase [Meiothermus sp.]